MASWEYSAHKACNLLLKVEMLQALRVYARFLEDTKKALIMSCPQLILQTKAFKAKRRQDQCLTLAFTFNSCLLTHLLYLVQSDALCY